MCRVVLEINDKFLSQETDLKALKMKKNQDHLIIENIWGISSPLTQWQVNIILFHGVQFYLFVLSENILMLFFPVDQIQQLQ